MANTTNHVSLSDCRKSGVAMRSYLETVYMMEEQQGRTQAGELAIALLETMLSGDCATDDGLIRMLTVSAREITTSAAEKYDKKVSNYKSKKRDEQQLDEIAEMLNHGFTQKEIGEQLDIKRSTLSDRVATIRRDYPELLRDNQDEKPVEENTSCATEYQSQLDNEDEYDF